VKNKIGVMQGRLLPKYQGRYQAHPVGYWQDEFLIAQTLGLDCIEFILDYNDAEENPLLKDGGIDEIKSVIEKTGVTVNTVCADYFMEAPLHSEDHKASNLSQQILTRIINNTSELGVTDLVIPCVDQSSLDSSEATDSFVKRLIPIVEVAENMKINLSLETDLAPQPFVNLLKRFNSDRVTVNYDIGNSAALGYDPTEELDAYGDRITDIHIKDRPFGGGSVKLGTGKANIPDVLKLMESFNYSGPLIMQAYRDDEGVQIFEDQLNWVKNFLNSST
jgi:sugar phosphate isomerase/epimerase